MPSNLAGLFGGGGGGGSGGGGGGGGSFVKIPGDSGIIIISK